MSIKVEISDESLDDITDHVLNSDEFATSVEQVVEGELVNKVSRAVEEALNDEDIESQVEKAVENYSDEFQKDIDNLKDQNAELKEKVALLEERLSEFQDNHDEQITSILKSLQSQIKAIEATNGFTNSILKVLESIPIIRRWFK